MLQKEGPLSDLALKRVAKGPTSCDDPGYVYVLNENPGFGGGRADHSTSSTEWKIGQTDNLERRMKQIARKNGKVYELRAFWEVPWSLYVQKIVHADLDNFKLPDKLGPTGVKEDGGTEWFGAEIGFIKARVELAVVVAARYADEAESLGAPSFSVAW